MEEAFLDSYRTAHAAGMILMDDWDRVMGEQWGKILNRDTVKIQVAYHPHEESPLADLYGFLAYERQPGFMDYVLYIYVKQNYRKQGIARGLFRSVGISDAFEYAAKTGLVTRLSHKIPRAVWNPIAVRLTRR